MRVLVTGSRDWKSWETVWDALYMQVAEGWETGITVVHGACPTGADYEAGRWCRMIANYGWPVDEEPHPADWNRYGKSAGFRRNAEMVNLGADLCLAFIRNNSKGASMTADLAQKAGIETRIYRED